MRPTSQGGRSFPWVPIAVVSGIVLIIGVLGYVVWQSNQSSATSGPDKYAQIEADPAPSLPGQFVDLEKIYDGYYNNRDGGPTTNSHVTKNEDYSAQGLPPVGGPHWGNGPCPAKPAEAPPFCGPVGWGIYRDPWPAESVVHSMEHGGLVVWYNTTNQQIISELEDLVTQKLHAQYLIVMLPYPDMEKETIAVTAWARRDKFPVSEYTKARVETFLDKMKCRFNPEKLPGKGC